MLARGVVRVIAVIGDGVLGLQGSRWKVRRRGLVQHRTYFHSGSSTVSHPHNGGDEEEEQCTHHIMVPSVEYVNWARRRMMSVQLKRESNASARFNCCAGTPHSTALTNPHSVKCSINAIAKYVPRNSMVTSHRSPVTPQTCWMPFSSRWEKQEVRTK